MGDLGRARMDDRGVMVVTGGNRGIGAAVSAKAAAAGWRVAILYRERADEAGALVERIRAAGGQAKAFRADVSREADVVAAFEAASGLGPITALVNNAGITGGVSRVTDVQADTLERVLAVNVLGAFLCAREAVRRMSTSRGGAGGSIVNVSSGASRTGTPGVWVHYAATKGAMDTMTLGLAKEVAAEGIRVNAVRPGLIDTEIHADRPPGQLERVLRAVPMGRIGTADEIADTILWLASPQAAYVNGALLDAAGGL